jgi:hypothetical protein
VKRCRNFTAYSPSKHPHFAGKSGRGRRKGIANEDSERDARSCGVGRCVVRNRRSRRRRRRVLQLRRSFEMDEQLPQQARSDAGGDGNSPAERLWRTAQPGIRWRLCRLRRRRARRQSGQGTRAGEQDAADARRGSVVGGSRDRLFRCPDLAHAAHRYCAKSAGARTAVAKLYRRQVADPAPIQSRQRFSGLDRPVRRIHAVP